MAMAEATPPRRCLPEEIVVWEILVRLPAKSLLRCRAVCCAWRRATSTRDFLLSHHGRQPTLPIVWGETVSGFKYDDASACYDELLALDHRAADAKLQSVARFDESCCYYMASCDGLLILYKLGLTETFFICNPVTREHAPLWIPGDFGISNVLGMYLHRPSGEYRLLLHGRSHMPKATIGCYVFVLGSNQQLRYIEGPDAAGALQFDTPALACHSLHWYATNERRLAILVFDTTTESFREMHAPAGPTKSSIFESSIFEMDDKLGFYGYNDANKVLDMWVLQNYEGEVWVRQYNINLPVEEILGLYGCWNDDSYGSVVSVDGDVLLLVSHGGWLFYVDTDGKVVDNFHRYGQQIYASYFRLKQTLVPHNFFTTLEDHAANGSPFL
ncbi:F-box protein At5g49610-like [Lolium perenne]|uniref:F-box protein At5g49610-like n=1 Tax=Lolium perenne TaxID=4522 RepID=UPI003A994EBC